MKLTLRVVLMVPAILLAACAHHPADDPADPLEPVNRVVFTVNEKADQYVLRPVAKGYATVVPEPVRNGVTNFFDNLNEPRTIVNDVLQGKLRQSFADSGRFLLNLTAGLAGFVDVASEVGLKQHKEDFGQTLGKWGVGEGWYLMLPLFGPSDNRDLVGLVVDQPLKPSFYVPGRFDVYRYSAQFVDVLNIRANLLSSDRLLKEQFDRYLFVRTAFLQRRQSLIYDGNPPLEDYALPDDSPAPAESTPGTGPAAPVAAPDKQP